MISAETKDLLEGFEKRMRFVNLVKYLLLRSKPTDIQEIFQGNDDKADNLILMVMLFIMDSTLRYGEHCTKRDIIAFLHELSDMYDFAPESADRLADYIVTDVLQSGGKLRLFDTYQSGKEQFGEQSSLVVTEAANGSYVLTNEAYEFLFRTKEIDSELDFSVNRFKMQEFIKRGNYSKALVESRELVSRIRSLKTRMDNFLLRCRTNVNSVTVDEYDEIITQVKNSFDDESRQLRDIRALVSAKLRAISDFSSDEKSNIGQIERNISEILANIDTVISEQSRVYSSKFTLSDEYARLLDESFSCFRSERFDFEQELLIPLQKISVNAAADMGKLFQTLYKPAFHHLFSPYFFYEKQNEIKSVSADSGIDISGEDTAETIADLRNARYTEIIRSLFLYASKHSEFYFGDYLKSLSEKELAEQTEGNLLPDVMLKLYAQNEINTEQWRAGQRDLIIPVGEFDLSYCLGNIPEELVQMNQIMIHKENRTITFSDGKNSRIKMNDFKVEVKR